jgi:type IV secretory pathway VirB2 component (pilin)
MKLGISIRTHQRSLPPAALLALAMFLQTFAVAHAATSSGMPWDQPLNQIVTALTGSVAHVIGVIALFGLGCGFAFSEGGSMMRKALFVVLGLTLAFNAATWGLQFLGLGGGLVV